MQIDRDGNFLMPQVDGPANLLSGGDEKNDKIDLTEDPVLEKQDDSQVADSGSTEQDANATSTEDPVLENQEDSQVADSGIMEQDAGATSTEDSVLENQEDSQVVNSGSTKQDADATSTEDPVLENCDVGRPTFAFGRSKYTHMHTLTHINISSKKYLK